MRHAHVRVLAGVALCLAAFAVAAGALAQPADGNAGVLVIRVDDAITTVIADHVVESVAAAEEGDHAALLIEIDTPGGLDTAMRSIVQALLGADVPVIVHVTPSGARAASAGALIAWSAHVLAMAPGTTIGAATPVDLEGGEVGDKIVNDAAAFARAVAEERGHNVEIAAEAVTKGRSLSASEAVELDAADLEVAGRTELLDAVDGIDVVLAGGRSAQLDTAGAPATERDLSFARQVLQFLADPNLAFLFMSIGTLAIIYELATPGIGIGAGIGLVLILLALFSLSVLPIDAAGLVFLALAMLLFAAELFAPGIGVAAALGSVSLVLAALFLFREDAPGMSISLAAVLPTVAVVGLGVVVAGRLALRAREAPAPTGPRGFVGREVTVARAGGTTGQANVEGSWWRLRSDSVLATGDRVRISDVDGLDLIVEPVDNNEKERTS